MDSFFCKFIGEYEIAMDSKNRLALPSKWKEDIGEKVFLYESPDGVLTMKRQIELDQQMARISKLDSFAADARVVKRNFFASLTEVVLDKWKRFVMPGKIIAKRAWDGLDSLILVGLGDHIEIWSKADYENWKSGDESKLSYAEASERLAKTTMSQ